MRPLKALIIGAGRIGAMNDRPSNPAILTHAHAFSSLPGTTLLGFVEKDLACARAAVRRWGGTADSLDGFFRSHGRIDIVSIASPDHTHEEYLLDLARRDVALVFAEKPLCPSLAGARRIASLYAKRRIPLAVNYSRRYVPEFGALSADIARGRYGSFLGGSGRYGKGLVHNGTHMIDLLRFLLGPVAAGAALDAVSDFVPSDLTRTVLLKVRGKQFFLLAVPQDNYTVFDADLLFEKAKITIADSGRRIEIASVIDDPVYSGYRVLGKPAVIETSLTKALGYAARSLRAYLVSGSPLKCTAGDAVEALRVCERLR